MELIDMIIAAAKSCIEAIICVILFFSIIILGSIVSQVDLVQYFGYKFGLIILIGFSVVFLSIFVWRYYFRIIKLWG